jgi:hypothetical protein
MVDAAGTATDGFAAGGPLWTEDLPPQGCGKVAGLWASKAVSDDC